MANEFRIKHGLIVTGSSYISESMYAPNLPTEIAPDYYITWRQSDGRFEISTTSPAQASTAACWDYGNASSAGEFETNTSGVGSTTTNLYFNNEDNLTNNQFSTLATIGKGSNITIYSGPFSTQFTVGGVTSPVSNANTLYYNFAVTYVSGDQYTPTAEVCLGVTAAVPSGGSTGQCVEFVQSSNFSSAASTAGEGGFDRSVNNINYTPPFGTIDNNVVGLFLNATTNSSTQTNTKSFLQNFTKGDTISIEYGAKTTYFTVDSVNSNSSNTNSYVGVTYNLGDLNYTITTGDTYNLCKI